MYVCGMVYQSDSILLLASMCVVFVCFKITLIKTNMLLEMITHELFKGHNYACNGRVSKRNTALDKVNMHIGIFCGDYTSSHLFKSKTNADTYYTNKTNTFEE